MRLPRGWHYNQFAARRYAQEDRAIKCDDCGWEGQESDLDDRHSLLAARDLNERLTPGDPVPVGLCPALPRGSADTCDCFVYYDDIVIAYKAMVSAKNVERE